MRGCLEGARRIGYNQDATTRAAFVRSDGAKRLKHQGKAMNDHLIDAPSRRRRILRWPLERFLVFSDAQLVERITAIVAGAVVANNIQCGRKVW